jgi:hypothetical protein
MEVNCQFHALAALISGEISPGTHCTGGWVGPKTNLDAMEKRKIFGPCRESNSNSSAIQPVQNICQNVGFEILTIVNRKITVL